MNTKSAKQTKKQNGQVAGTVNNRTYPFYGTDPRIDIFIKNPNLINVMLYIRDGIEIATLEKRFCTSNYIFNEIKETIFYKGETREEIQKVFDFLCGRGLLTVKKSEKEQINYYGDEIIFDHIKKFNAKEYSFSCSEEDSISTSCL